MPVREQVQYTVLFEPAEEGGYVVTCPALPGLVTEGDTLAEARVMAADAIRAYLDGLRSDGQPVKLRGIDACPPPSQAGLNESDVVPPLSRR